MPPPRAKASQSSLPANPDRPITWMLHEPVDALSKMLDAVKPIKETETIPIQDACDRVLAADFRSPLTLPAQNRSERDGYAIRSADTTETPVTLEQIGAITAGSPRAITLKPKTCVRIATGGVMPKGADSVVMFEDVSAEGQHITLSAPVPAGQWVAAKGSDLKKGKLVLSRGTILSPLNIAALGSMGSAEISVFRRPRALVFTTGNEVQQRGRELEEGQVYDGNTMALVALLRQHGIEAHCRRTVRDTLKSLTDALVAGAAKFDLIVFTGGTSVGDKDFGRRALDIAGETLIHGVNLKPGKPLLFGKIGSCFVFGLPGFPTSALMLAYNFLLPFTEELSNVGGSFEPMLQAELAHDLKIPAGVTFCVPVAVDDWGLAHQVFHGSASISSVARADGYITVLAEDRVPKAGEMVVVRLT